MPFVYRKKSGRVPLWRPGLLEEAAARGQARIAFAGGEVPSILKDMRRFLARRSALLIYEVDPALIGHSEDLDRYLRRHLEFQIGTHDDYGVYDFSVPGTFSAGIHRGSEEALLPGERPKRKFAKKPQLFWELLIGLCAQQRLSFRSLCREANLDPFVLRRALEAGDVMPSRGWVIAFAAALRLKAEDWGRLMQAAGYEISNSSVRDLIVRYYLERRVYDLYLINLFLFAYRQPQLPGD